MAVKFEVRAAVADDADAIAVIYNQGIEDRVATLETELRDRDERRKWLRKHGKKHPAIVAEAKGRGVVGWASISHISHRSCYSGVGEFSVYVRRDTRGAGVGSEAARFAHRQGDVPGLLEADRPDLFLQRGEHPPRKEPRIQRGRGARKARQARRQVGRRGRVRETDPGEHRLGSDRSTLLRGAY